jgi:hypothetical protein
MPLTPGEQNLHDAIYQGAELVAPKHASSQQGINDPTLVPQVLPQSVTSLLILNSSNVGSRWLWWIDSPAATKGYNVYRAFDNPAAGWTRLNGNVPWPGHSFQDTTVLTEKTYEVQPQDFVEKGEMGKWGFKLPETAYSSAVKGRPVVANSPDDVVVTVDGKPLRPVMVVGIDQTVWMQMDNTLPTGGAVTNLALVNNGDVGKADYSGVQKWTVKYKSLTNFVDIYSTLTRTYYTVVPVGPTGEIHAPGAPGTPIVNSQEVEQMNYIAAEMIRRNAWVFEMRGEPSYALFRKTRGVICGCKTTGVAQPRHGCPSCFEVGVVGGYYGPYDILYIDPDQAAVRELQEGGVTVTREAMSYLGPTPIVQDGDLIVRRNGERLVINNVNYKSWQGCIVQQEFKVTLLNKGDTRYLIPINTGMVPTIFNPIVKVNPLDGQGNGEPITDARTEPDKVWENPDPQVGRTVTFGKIQR